MGSSTNAQATSIVDIAPDGDILLAIGPDKIKLRVKSMLLMAASKPFSAMLGPNWKEGHDMRHHDGPLEILLPDDDATALEIICLVVHHQNDRVPQSLAAGDMLAIAVTADKYDCINALGFASNTWLRDLKVKPEDLMLLTAVAYLFRNAQAFKEVTAALVLNHNNSYLGLLGKEVESVLPWKLLCMCFNEHLIAKPNMPMNRLARGAKRLREVGNSRYTHKRSTLRGLRLRMWMDEHIYPRIYQQTGR
ncbi:btb poz [Fusarium acutatum]|uniref:Btb poz n=1 Tax=Fusarium acutatum TaxID=78861 RepID=A0A8H4NP73_9HYPO|nr:btb poz [Fusarium acutatum]